MSVTATILAFNAGKAIGLVLDAVTSQSVSPDRVIVVDNASQDGTVDIARGHGADVIALNTNIGVGAGHNLAIARAFRVPQCSAVWILEHDTIPEPDCLRSLIVTSGGDGVGVVTSYLARTTKELMTYRAGATAGRLPTYLVDHSQERQRFTFNSILLKRACRDQVGEIREDFFVGHEDWEYGRRVVDCGWRVAHAPNALALHANKGMRRATGPGRLSFSHEPASRASPGFDADRDGLPFD
jgi:GT2 family glycosyltransferase